MAKKMTENERRLTKEINRLRKEVEHLKNEISSLEVDLSIAKGEFDSKEDDDVVNMMEDLSDLSEDDFAMYSVEEIGFETSYESVSSLLFLARYHCESYEDRQAYLPIDTVSEAIKYLTENGFKVTEV